MKAKQYRRFLLLIAAITIGVTLAAQGLVRLELTSYKVTAYTDKQGHLIERFEQAFKVAPGDVIEWRLRAVNASKQELQDVGLVIPIPPQTYYLEGSAKPLAVALGGSKKNVLPEFSYDGGKTYGKPPLYKEVTVVEDGKKVVKKVLVSPEEYTHIRWMLPVMAPGQKIEVSLRTKVR